MDLRVAGIGKVGTLAVSPPSGRDVATHGIGGKVKDISVTAGAKKHRVSPCMSFDLSGHEVAGDDAFGMSIDDDDFQHFRASVHFHTATSDFFIQGRVSAEQELLAGLATGIEGAADLSTTEGAVG
jgi:hypothetical protein